MAQRQIPGGSFINETGTVQRQIPGGSFINETASSGTTPTLSLPGVDQITTTGARPYVSLGF